ncbi:MAG: hypothetical protein AB7D33_12830 [Sphingobium sp.]
MLGLALVLAASAPQAAITERIAAPEANQGVAAGRKVVYAISNHEIGEYDKRTGKRLRHWEGDPAHFRHMNSCTLVSRDLVCAASNYPATPMRSMVELFDTRTLTHSRTIALDGFPGSLTVLTRHKGRWWAVFANYDSQSGATGRDHRDSLLVELDRNFREIRRFHFPASVLERFAPRSCSGAQWGKGGLLYVTGHDRPELYALRVPEKGTQLAHVATYAIATNGQAIDWDPEQPDLLWSIERSTREMVAARVDLKAPLRSGLQSGSPENH